MESWFHLSVDCSLPANGTLLACELTTILGREKKSDTVAGYVTQ